MESLVSFFTTYVRPFLDVVVLAFLIYQVYKILLQNNALPAIKGVVAAAALYALAYIFQLDTILWILNRLAGALIIIVAIIFQSEIRNFFIKVGQSRFLQSRHRTIGTEVESVVSAAEILSSMKRGALVVFSRQTGLKNIIDTGTILNADISSSLIVTIFGKDTALHDGAIIISGKKSVAAGCFLPLSEQKGIRKSFGTRHRAALGTAETTDAVVLIVSEETGAISLAYNSNLYYDLKHDELLSTLNNLVVLGLTQSDSGEDEE